MALSQINPSGVRVRDPNPNPNPNPYQMSASLPSARQHPSYGDCLEVKSGEMSSRL